MKAEYAEQYGKVCLVLDGSEGFQEVIDRAYKDEATYDDGEEICFVLRFPDRSQELYTERALWGSLGRPSANSIRRVTMNHEFCVIAAFIGGIGVGLVVPWIWNTFVDDGYRWW